MVTRKIQLPEVNTLHSQNLKFQHKMRSIHPKHWHEDSELCELYSGTLLKSIKLGCLYVSAAIHEALAATLGWTFETIPSSRITFGEALVALDTSAFTEALWHTNRMLKIHPWDEDKFELKYLSISEDQKQIREGLGLVLKQTSIQWIPEKNLVFCMLCEVGSDGEYKETVNPF